MPDSAVSEPIFISYRRADSRSTTERIYDRLKTAFGDDAVFKDASSILGGTDFAKRLDKAVSQCQLILVIIGKTWLTVTNADGTRRLDHPEDWVRIEVEAALKREIPVIPVLIEGAKMPAASELPASLQQLTRYQFCEVGNDPRFDDDVNRLIADIQSHLGLDDIALNSSIDESLGKNVQNIRGGSGVQINDPKAPVLTGNISGSTINITTN
ncbi:toll/interleukin-1 receptor domain-containing protein [Leptothoe sp. EHU-05/26/07-4]